MHNAPVTSYRMEFVFADGSRELVRVNMGAHTLALVEQLHRDARGGERWEPARGQERALTALLAWFLKGGRRAAEGVECSIGEVTVPNDGDPWRFAGLSMQMVGSGQVAVVAASCTDNGQGVCTSCSTTHMMPDPAAHTARLVETGPELFRPSPAIPTTDWRTAQSCAKEIAKRIESGMFAPPEEENRWRRDLWMLMENLACCLRFELKGPV